MTVEYLLHFDHCSTALMLKLISRPVLQTEPLIISTKYNRQVAQLWQRDGAKLDTFLINVQRYSQNHAQNGIFASPYGGIRGNISALSERFNAKKLCSRVSSIECQFYSLNSELAFLCHPFLGSRV